MLCFFLLITYFQVKDQLKTGKKSSDACYIKLPAKLRKYVVSVLHERRFFLLKVFYSRNIRINDKRGNMMAMICPTMPQNMRRPLMSIFKSTFSENFGAIDTTQGKAIIRFPAYHFHYYNRYNVQVNHSPCRYYIIYSSISRATTKSRMKSLLLSNAKEWASIFDRPSSFPAARRKRTST